jgi:hypothetical protein
MSSTVTVMGFPDANDSTFAFGNPISEMYCLGIIVLKECGLEKTNQAWMEMNEKKEKKLGFADGCKC